MTDKLSTMLEAGKFRWPRKGDRLLQKATDWESAIDFPENANVRHALMWYGYFRAGAALISVAGEDRHDRNTLIYPALFNYRHGVELAMKWFIEHYARYSTVEADDHHDHNILHLWRICRSIIEEADSRDVEANDAVEQVIKDLHDLDVTAQGFRYSRSKTGDAILLKEGYFDLMNIADVMEGVANFFVGADGLLDDLSSAVPY